MSDTTATQTGADIQSAASAIMGLLDVGSNPPSNPESSAAPEATAEHTEIADNTPDEIQDAPSEPSTEPTEDAGDEQDTIFPDNIDQLAARLSIEPEQLLTLKVKTKINGQEGEVPLSDLVKSYQLESNLNQKSMQLAEERKNLRQTIETELQQQFTQQLGQQFQNAQVLLQTLAAENFQDYQSIDWKQLEIDDPAEFAAKQIKFQQKQQAILSYAQQINEHFAQESAKQQSQQKAIYEQHMAEQVQQLFSKLPEWAQDSNKLQAEQQEIRRYLQHEGFNNDELSTIADHRAIVVARKAMLYDKLIASKPDVTKKVVNLPKFLKPGTTKNKSDIAAEKKQEQLNRLRKSGHVRDAAAAILSRL